MASCHGRQELDERQRCCEGAVWYRLSDLFISGTKLSLKTKETTKFVRPEAYQAWHFSAAQQQCPQRTKDDDHQNAGKVVALPYRVIIVVNVFLVT